MNFGESGSLSDQVRFLRSRTWLQFHVDFYSLEFPKRCTDFSLIVVSDALRRNGCNWEVLINTPPGQVDDERFCLQYIRENLRLLFSLYDMEEDHHAAEGLDQGFAPSPV